MKILNVNGAASGGGIERYLEQLFNELGAMGHQSLLIYGDRSAEGASLLKDEARFIEGITRFDCQDLDVKLEQVTEILKSYDPDLVYFHQVLNAPLIDLLAGQKPSVRFAHGFKLVCPDGRKMLKSTGAVCGYPLGYTCQVHAYQYRCMPRNPLNGIPLIRHFKKIRAIHQRRSYMVVASEFMKSVLIRNGFRENRIAVIPYFTCFPKSGGWAATGNEPIIICVGRVIREKGMHHLIGALPAVHGNARLIIVGDGPAIDELKNLAEELDMSSRITFAGWLSHDKLDVLYRRCTLAVVPSVWPEPFGIVGIEAMAYERPVVAFDVGGISEWLKEGESGFLVKGGDEKALAEKINVLLENPDTAGHMGVKAKRLAENRFAADLHMRMLISVFERAVNQFTEGQ